MEMEGPKRRWDAQMLRQAAAEARVGIRWDVNGPRRRLKRTAALE